MIKMLVFGSLFVLSGCVGYVQPSPYTVGSPFISSPGVIYQPRYIPPVYARPYVPYRYNHRYHNNHRYNRYYR